MLERAYPLLPHHLPRVASERPERARDPSRRPSRPIHARAKRPSRYRPMYRRPHRRELRRETRGRLPLPRILSRARPRRHPRPVIALPQPPFDSIHIRPRVFRSRPRARQPRVKRRHRILIRHVPLPVRRSRSARLNSRQGAPRRAPRAPRAPRVRARSRVSLAVVTAARVRVRVRARSRARGAECRPSAAERARGDFSRPSSRTAARANAMRRSPSR